MDITNYAAILLMDATGSRCNDTHIHIHGAGTAERAHAHTGSRAQDVDTVRPLHN